MRVKRGRAIAGWSVAVMLSALGAEAAPDSAAPPDAEFLEFLGSWTAGEAGPGWIDPFQLDGPIDRTSDPPQRSRPEPKDPTKAPAQDRAQSRTQQTPDPRRPGEGNKP